MHEILACHHILHDDNFGPANDDTIYDKYRATRNTCIRVTRVTNIAHLARMKMTFDEQPNIYIDVAYTNILFPLLLMLFLFLFPV